MFSSWRIARTIWLTHPPRTTPKSQCPFWVACLTGRRNTGVESLCLRFEKCHVWTAPSWQELFHVLQHWSVQPCVRPFNAAHMTAGHNALRGSGPDQQLAFKNALAHVGCPDRWIDRLCITCGSPSQPSHHAGCAARSRLSRKRDGFLVLLAPGHHGPNHSRDLVGERDSRNLGRPPRGSRYSFCPVDQLFRFNLDFVFRFPLGLGSILGHPLTPRDHRRAKRPDLRRPCRRPEPQSS